MFAPAIVLSAHTMGLGVVRALGPLGVPVVVLGHDERDMAQVSRYVTEYIRAPHPEKQAAQFIDLLMQLGPRLAGGLLMPTSDEALVAVAQHKALLETHYVVGCAEWPVIERCIDKKYTASAAVAVGVPAPRAITPETTALDEMLGYAEQVGYPCLLKPCQSHLFYDHFKRKMVQVADAAQMRQVYPEIVAAGLEVMLQEIIPGDDTHVVNYNSYFWDGQPVVEFTARHVRNAPPMFGSPRVVVSEDIPAVIDPGRKTLQAIEYSGYSCMELKHDPRDGVYKLMEVNGRHNLSTMLAVHLGVNFPWLEYQHRVLGQFPPPQTYREGVYWIDLTRDVAYSLSHRRQEHVTVGQFMEPYRKPHVFAILDWKDPRPFVTRCTYLVKEALRMVGPGATATHQPHGLPATDQLVRGK